MLRLRLAVIAAAFIPAAALAQNSGSIDLLNFAMSDAQILAGANVTAAINSPVGQFFLSRLGSDDKGLQEFIQQTGFDPRTDVRELIVAGTGAPGHGSKWLIAAHGSFGVAMTNVEAFVEKAGGTITHLAGVDLLTLHTSDDAGTAPCLAFYLDGSTALIGDCGSLNAAIQSKGAKLTVSAALGSQATSWRAKNDLWFTSTLSLGQFAPPGMTAPGPLGSLFNSDLLKSIQQTSGGIKFTASTIQVSGQAVTDTAANATALLNVLNFVTSMVTANKSNDPGIAALTALLGSLQASTSGNALNVQLTVPDATLEQFLQSHGPGKPAVE